MDVMAPSLPGAAPVSQRRKREPGALHPKVQGAAEVDDPRPPPPAAASLTAAAALASPLPSDR